MNAMDRLNERHGWVLSLFITHPPTHPASHQPFTVEIDHDQHQISSSPLQRPRYLGMGDSPPTGILQMQLAVRGQVRFPAAVAVAKFSLGFASSWNWRACDLSCAATTGILETATI
jgi:hypothetical protein